MKFIKEKSVMQALEKYDFDESIKSEIKEIYECYASINECDKLKSKVEDVLIEIFKNPASSEVYLPLKFLKSTLGIFLMSIYVDAPLEYSPNDLVKKTGYTRQHIYNEIDEGNIVADKTSGKINITESELKRYLKAKNRL